MKEREVKKAVRRGYARIAKRSGSCCAPAVPCCTGEDSAHKISREIGYSEEELKSIPEGTDLGLGCGNPVALASLKEGEIVLDLGSGTGLDCFLAAKKVGSSGKVIGVDMTPEMIERARENAEKGNYENVEFRLGEIENLPAADNSVDVVISNCVINLVPNKAKVFKEAFRVLKPSGRLMVSDIVLLKELPDVVKRSVTAYVGCLAGAMMRDEYLATIKAAGFRDVKAIEEKAFTIDCMINDPTAKAIIADSKIPAKKLKETENAIISIRICGIKHPSLPAS